uniref:Solute carrier family 25 member 44-like n=1 Tax=Phallusia mammillata TaxID=59560 RepID=A0A6F9DRW0_9ASCI|nr:solute carrier family 25 member 44-like [Phallusia mammillata]
MKEGKNIQIIEWTDLDKKKFYAYGLAMSGVLRFTIYPMNLVKTRLQAQEGKTAYNGLIDAFKKIGKREGIRGFYKGFPISLLQVFAGQLYITAYETSKQTIFNNQSLMVQHLCGGFMASTVSQTIMVPVDIIAQHQQVLGSRHKMTSVDLKKTKNGAKVIATEAVQTKKLSFIGQSVRIFRHILKTEGLKGLYRGYLVSLSTYGSNSAFYWGFYYLYSELLEGVLPHSDSWVREQFRILSAGLLGSTTAVLLTNPLDVVRTRYQLQVANSSGTSVGSWQIFRTLLNKEGYHGLTRGMSARIAQSSISSCVIVLAYEYIKKSSLNDDARARNGYETHPRTTHKILDHSRYGDIDDVSLVPTATK